MVRHWVEAHVARLRRLSAAASQSAACRRIGHTTATNSVLVSILGCKSAAPDPPSLLDAPLVLLPGGAGAAAASELAPSACAPLPPASPSIPSSGAACAGVSETFAAASMPLFCTIAPPSESLICDTRRTGW